MDYSDAVTHFLNLKQKILKIQRKVEDIIDDFTTAKPVKIQTHNEVEKIYKFHYEALLDYGILVTEEYNDCPNEDHYENELGTSIKGKNGYVQQGIAGYDWDNTFELFDGEKYGICPCSETNLIEEIHMVRYAVSPVGKLVMTEVFSKVLIDLEDVLKLTSRFDYSFTLNQILNKILKRIDTILPNN